MINAGTANGAGSARILCAKRPPSSATVAENLQMRGIAAVSPRTLRA
jgi:hypothetical protein